MDGLHFLLLSIIALLLYKDFIIKKLDKAIKEQDEQLLTEDRAYMKKLEKFLMNHLLQKRKLAKK